VDLEQVFQPTHGPNGGVADSLDEAKAAFRAAGQRPLSDLGGAAKQTSPAVQRAREGETHT